MGKPRIVHVTTSLGMGGAEHFLYQLVAGLQSTTDQAVVCFHDGVFGDRIRALGVPVWVVPYGPSFLFKFWRVLRQSKPDVIHALLWTSNLLARLVGLVLRVPVVCAIHSPVNSDGYDSRVRSVIDRLTIGLANRVIIVSQQVRETCSAIRYIPAQRVMVIDNGIDVDYVQNLARQNMRSRAMLGLGAEHIVLGTVGRLVPLKNQQLLLRVLAQLSGTILQLRLVIVGDGPLRAELEALAHSLGVRERVYFVSDIAAPYYPLFDMFVLPSYVEGLSMALLEAMSFCLPVLVASATGKHDVIVDGDNGLLFSSQNVDELVHAICDLSVDTVRCNRLGIAAQKTVHDHFAFARVTEQYRRVLLNCSKRSAQCAD